MAAMMRAKPRRCAVISQYPGSVLLNACSVAVNTSAGINSENLMPTIGLKKYLTGRAITNTTPEANKNGSAHHVHGNSRRIISLGCWLGTAKPRILKLTNMIEPMTMAHMCTD